VQLDPDVVALLESGCSMIIGTVDASGTPLATRGWGAAVEADGRVRVLLALEADAARANLAATGKIAIGATDVPTLRSIQVKGEVVAIEPPTDADRDRSDRHREGFFRDVHETDGIPIEVLLRVAPGGLEAVTVVPTEVFDQTPGPGAGAPIPSA
jgi:hypothetical protein